ncbi:MAG TPA: tetratricopeptide repeat protein, partial [Candidatus Dormibacteraeota bacterium]|nr:tetratricopeptide repeat protein [Candidatus Dormibacteraeota bacterium]
LDGGPARLGRADGTGASVAVPLGRLPVEVRGREQLLRSLQDRRGLVVLAGMGGVGKSTVAAELARRAHFGRQVWWVSAADTSSLTAGIVSVARRLGAKQLDLEALETQAGDAPDRLWDLLEAAREGWLLVLDNADQPEALAARGAVVADGTGWVRAGGRGLVVVTSRNGDHVMWGSRATIHRLQSLDATEAGRVLLDLAPRGGTPQQAEALGRRLGGLPLALHLAGQHVRSQIMRRSTFEAYREALDHYPAASGVLATDSDIELTREQRTIVMQTWELSLDALAERGLPEGRALLRLLSCYAPGVAIPLWLLDPHLLAAFWTSLAIAGASTPTAEHVLRGLSRQGLIDVWTDEDALVVHPVMADTNRAHLLAPTASDPQPALVRQMAVTLVSAAVRTLDPDQPSEWPRFRQLAPHILALLRATADHVDDDHAVALVDAAIDVAAGLTSANTISSALALMSAAVALEQRLGGRHPAILSAKNRIAYAVGEQGRWAEAEAAYRQVLDARRQVLGNDHPDTLATRHSLAFVVARRGRWVEAEAEFRKVLDAMTRTLGADHPSTLDAQHYLARAMADLGRWREAEVSLLATLEAKQRVLGAEHPSTLVTRHYLGLVVAWQGRWAEADGILQGLLETRRRVLGPEHTSTLITRLAVAHHRASGGRLAEAEAALREVLETTQRVHGPEHPGTLRVRDELARLAGEQGRWPEAEAAFREVLDIQRRVLGDDHPDTLRMRHELARAAAEQGRWAEAKTALQEILEDRRRVLGNDHPDTLGTLDVLVDAERKQSRQA